MEFSTGPAFGRIHISKPSRIKKELRALKSLNLLPRGYKINQLTENQARHARRLRAKYSELISNSDKFLTTRIDFASAKKLRDKGYTAVRTSRGVRLIVERQHSKRVKFQRGPGTITRYYDNRENRTYPFDDSARTLTRVESFFESNRQGEYLTFRIGDKSPFNIALHNLRDFEKYKTRFDEAIEARDEQKPFTSPRAGGSGKQYHSSDPRSELQIVEVKGYEPKTRRKAKKGNRQTQTGRKSSRANARGSKGTRSIPRAKKN